MDCFSRTRVIYKHSDLVGVRVNFNAECMRTMAEGESGYNPIGYHNGTVWPHDNSIIAAGSVERNESGNVFAIAFGQ